MDLQGMADGFAALADITVGGGTITHPNWGDQNNYQVVHVTGDVHLAGNGQGGGVLIIDGDLDCTGQFTWYGLVIVLGDMRFSGGGSGKHIYGSVLVQGGVSDQTISGNADILYSSIALNRLAYLAPYETIAWHEL
jgi:hypothetical protein